MKSPSIYLRSAENKLLHYRILECCLIYIVVFDVALVTRNKVQIKLQKLILRPYSNLNLTQKRYLFSYAYLKYYMLNNHIGVLLLDKSNLTTKGSAGPFALQTVQKRAKNLYFLKFYPLAYLLYHKISNIRGSALKGLIFGVLGYFQIIGYHIILKHNTICVEFPNTITKCMWKPGLFQERAHAKIILTSSPNWQVRSNSIEIILHMSRPGNQTRGT